MPEPLAFARVEYRVLDRVLVRDTGLVARESVLVDVAKVKDAIESTRRRRYSLGTQKRKVLETVLGQIYGCTDMYGQLIVNR